MKQICLDTETTGLSKDTDRIVEIGCVEIENLIPTGRSYHQYINPKRSMPREAERIHGISAKFLEDKPIFRQIAPEFLDFIGDTELVIHNAPFDLKFLNAELERIDRPPLKNPIVDTILVSRKVRPGKSYSLDAICRDYKIDLSKRTQHGALLDAEILATAYLHLEGGPQHKIGGLVGGGMSVDAKHDVHIPGPGVRTFQPRISPEEFFAHQKFIEEMGDKCLWLSSD